MDIIKISKTKIKMVLGKDAPKTINALFDIIKADGGDIVEYSDSYIIIEGNKETFERVRDNKLIEKITKLENV